LHVDKVYLSWIAKHILSGTSGTMLRIALLQLRCHEAIV
jgi:hypothetical protein